MFGVPSDGGDLEHGRLRVEPGEVLAGVAGADEDQVPGARGRVVLAVQLPPGRAGQGERGDQRVGIGDADALGGEAREDGERGRLPDVGDARLAARDWAAGAHPDVDLQGLVLVADAPGRTPKPLATATRVISGGVPSTWVVHWIEELRLTGAVDWASMAREPRKVLTALGEAADEALSERTPQ